MTLFARKCRIVLFLTRGFFFKTENKTKNQKQKDKIVIKFKNNHDLFLSMDFRALNEKYDLSFLGPSTQGISLPPPVRPISGVGRCL